jgi:hypothetical protein
VVPGTGLKSMIHMPVWLPNPAAACWSTSASTGGNTTTVPGSSERSLADSVTGRFPAVYRAGHGYCWSWMCHGPREPPIGLASDARGEVCEQQVHDDLFFDGHQVIKHRGQQVRVPQSSCLSSRRREPFWT